MTHTAQALLKSNLRQYKTPTTKDAYERGFDRGYTCASWQDLPSDSDVDDGDSHWDTVQFQAYEAESNDRDFSPFEFTASEFNKARNSEARWEAFDAGISDGIQSNIADRIKALDPHMTLAPQGGSR